MGRCERRLFVQPSSGHPGLACERRDAQRPFSATSRARPPRARRGGAIGRRAARGGCAGIGSTRAHHRSQRARRVRERAIQSRRFRRTRDSGDFRPTARARGRATPRGRTDGKAPTGAGPPGPPRARAASPIARARRGGRSSESGTNPRGKLTFCPEKAHDFVPIRLYKVTTDLAVVSGELGVKPAYSRVLYPYAVPQ